MKRILMLSALLTAALVAAACPAKKKDNNDALVLGALLLSQNATPQPTTELAASQATTAVVQAVAAGSGSLGVRGVALHSPMMRLAATAPAGPRLIPTAITNSGGPCTSTMGTTSCTGTMNGTASCPLGGSVTMNNVGVTMNLSVSASMAVTGTFTVTSGSIDYAGCKVTYEDPLTKATVQATVTGGLSNLNFSDNISATMGTPTVTGTSIAYQGTFTEVYNDTATFSAFNVNGTSIADGSHTINTNTNGNDSVNMTSGTSTFQFTQTRTYGANSTVSMDGVVKYDLSGRTVTRSQTCSVSGSSATCN